MLRVRWLFFDLGDTLWRSSTPDSRRALYDKAGARMVERLNHWGCRQLPEASLVAERVWNSIEAAIEEDAATTLVASDPAVAVAKALASLRINTPLEQARELWSLLQEAAPERGITLLDGAVSILEALARRGLRLGVITNRTLDTATTRRDLACLGLDGYFEHVIVSADVGHLKPHPRIFQAALSAAGAPAQDCALVGDNLRTDVQGAQDAGLRAIWKRSALTTCDRPVTPDATIERLSELLDVVETLR